jgi:hypothetical protein
MPIDPHDGIDDWFVPTASPAAADGRDDWFVPAPARADPYPDDWFVPAPAASPSTGAPAPNAQPNRGNPGRSNPPAARPDPLADYWSLIPAARAGAMAWQPPIFLPPNPSSHENIPASKWITPPPIFLNSPGQPLLPRAAAPGFPSIPTGGLLDAPATNSPRSGLLDALANLPSAEPAPLPWLQGPRFAAGAGGQSPTPPLFQNLGNLPSLPQSIASGDFRNVSDGDAIEGDNAGQSSETADPLFTPPLEKIKAERFALGPTMPVQEADVSRVSSQ